MNLDQTLKNSAVEPLNGDFPPVVDFAKPGSRLLGVYAQSVQIPLKDGNKLNAYTLRLHSWDGITLSRKDAEIIPREGMPVSISGGYLDKAFANLQPGNVVLITFRGIEGKVEGTRPKFKSNPGRVFDVALVTLPAHAGV